MLGAAWDWVVGLLVSAPEDSASTLDDVAYQKRMGSGPWLDAVWEPEDSVMFDCLVEEPLLVTATGDRCETALSGTEEAIAQYLGSKGLAGQSPPCRKRCRQRDLWTDTTKGNVPSNELSTWQALSNMVASSAFRMVAEESLPKEAPRPPKRTSSIRQTLDAVVAQTRQEDEISDASRVRSNAPCAVLANVFDSICSSRDSPALLPPQAPEFSGRKTLVLDLDETLVHSVFQPTPNASFRVTAVLEQGPLDVFVAKRPGVDDFLKSMTERYEVVVFTASVKEYADPVMDRLDPERRVPHRLFREACASTRNGYVKDLSKLGRNLSDIIIVDNSPYSYAMQPDNALPILSFYDDMLDCELEKVTPFLESIANMGRDVRALLTEALGESVKGLLHARIAMLQ